MQSCESSINTSYSNSLTWISTSLSLTPCENGNWSQRTHKSFTSITCVGATNHNMIIIPMAKSGIFWVIPQTNCPENLWYNHLLGIYALSNLICSPVFMTFSYIHNLYLCLCYIHNLYLCLCISSSRFIS